MIFDSIGNFKCPLCKKLNCDGIFDTGAKAWEHAKEVHLDHFPWVCRCGYATNTGDKFITHWLTKHPQIKKASDVVHLEFGMHYSQLTTQVLK